MKKKLLILTISIVMLFSLGLLAGCNEQANQYTIYVKDVDGECFNFQVQANKHFKLNEELIPQKEGYTFGGLYLDEDCFSSQFVNKDCNSVEVFNYNKDISAYIKWIPKIYTLKYIFDDGVITSAQTSYQVEYNSSITQFPYGIKTGYHLDGWYTKNDNGIKVGDSSGIVLEGCDLISSDVYEVDNNTSTIYVYGKFLPDEYNATFYDCTNNKIITSKIPYETNLADASKDNSSCLLKEGYVTSWKNKNNEEITTMPNHDIDLYPNTLDKYICYNTNKEANIDEKIFHATPGEKVVLEKPFVENRGVARGWKYKGNIIDTIDAMPNENIILDVVWSYSRVEYIINGEVVFGYVKYNESPNSIEMQEFFTDTGYVYNWKNINGEYVDKIIDNDAKVYEGDKKPYITYMNGLEVIKNEICNLGKVDNMFVLQDDFEKFVGWKNSNDEFVSEVVFVNTNPIILKAYFHGICLEYVRDEEYRISSPNYVNNKIDVINIEELTGFTIKELQEKGYSRIQLDGCFYRREYDGGLQNCIISISEDGGKVLSRYEKLEHGQNKLCTNYVPLNISAKANSLHENIYVLWAATGGDKKNDWGCKNFTMTIYLE